MNKGRQSANTCLKYNTTTIQQSCEKKKPHFTIYVTKNYISLFLLLKKKGSKSFCLFLIDLRMADVIHGSLSSFFVGKLP